MQLSYFDWNTYMYINLDLKNNKLLWLKYIHVH